MGELIGDPHSKKSEAVMRVMLQMKKVKIADIKWAYDAA
jgi:hypothetical protein